MMLLFVIKQINLQYVIQYTKCSGALDLLL